MNLGVNRIVYLVIQDIFEEVYFEARFERFEHRHSLKENEHLQNFPLMMCGIEMCSTQAD